MKTITDNKLIVNWSRKSFEITHFHALSVSNTLRKYIILLLFIFLTISSYAQEKFIVTAENGLFLRKEPTLNSQDIGKVYFGAEVTILEETDNRQTIIDNGEEVSGNWVKVEYQNFPMFISYEESGYVFDGYLKEWNECVNELTKEVKNYSEFENLTLNTEILPFFLKGDFFGDGQGDLVVLLKNKEEETKIGFIDYGQKTEIHLLGETKDVRDFEDPLSMSDYSWIGVFERVNKGDVLWSNYEDDFIYFKDVPENKKVRLNYNALYMHAAESCGGGFVYWRNGKFNWLQQE